GVERDGRADGPATPFARGRRRAVSSGVVPDRARSHDPRDVSDTGRTTKYPTVPGQWYVTAVAGSMETVLVTGAAGTVGNSVVGFAAAAGFRVIASDVSAKGVQTPVRGEIRAGDLRDKAFVERVVKGVDHVIHTAAMLDVGTPYETLAAVNTEAVGALYDALAKNGGKRFVHVSTAMVYGVGQKGPLAEDARILPRGPHSRSKRDAEVLLEDRKG